jgi:hypothetical protein
MYTLIATASPNSVDPQTWLADVLRRIADHPARRLHELLPWNWQKPAIAYTGRRVKSPAVLPADVPADYTPLACGLTRRCPHPRNRRHPQ